MQVTCSGCKSEFKTNEKHLGKSIRCPICGEVVSAASLASLGGRDNKASSTNQPSSTPALPAPPDTYKSGKKPSIENMPNGSIPSDKGQVLNQRLLVWIGVILILVLIVVALVVLRPDTKKSVAENDNQNSKVKGSNKTENSGGKSGVNEKNVGNRLTANIDDVATAQGRSPNDQNKFSSLPTGTDVGYQIRLIETRENGSREWTGTVFIRPESPSSAVVVEKILDGARRKSKQILRSIRHATGIKVPNRWVLVGNNLVEGAKKITVRMEAKDYKAIVRHRLKRSGFAVLQIVEARLPKFSKLPIQLPDDNKLVKGPFNFLWFNSRGEIKFARNVKRTSATSNYGGEYFFTQAVPDEAASGFVFLQSGKAFGMVNDTNFPAPATMMKAKVIPFSRVIKTWPRETQAQMFDSNESATNLDWESQKASLKNYLVEVIIERDTAEDPEFPLRYDVDIDQSNPDRLRDYSDLKSVLRIRENGILFYSETENGEWKPSNSNLRQLPFFLGRVIENVVFPKPVNGVKKWERIRSIFIQEDGIYSTKRLQSAVEGIQTELFELIDETDSTYTIKRTINIQSSETSPGSSPSDCFFALPIRLTGQQIVEYSKELRGIRSSKFEGTFSANNIGKKIAGTDQYEKVQVSSKLELQIDLLLEPHVAAWNVRPEN